MKGSLYVSLLNPQYEANGGKQMLFTLTQSSTKILAPLPILFLRQFTLVITEQTQQKVRNTSQVMFTHRSKRLSKIRERVVKTVPCTGKLFSLLKSWLLQ